jgi:hypothetical protein
MSTAIVDHALSYAARGWHVLPLWPVDDTGRCACGNAECVRSAGKHPLWKLVPNGVLEATTDLQTIRQWWAAWPDANIGVALEPSGLLDIAPDCKEWLETFQENGLPATVAFQSGGGDGNRHHFYRRPADCPIYRINKSKQYDLSTGGYAVMPPSNHKSGRRYTWLVNPDQRNVADAPDWAVTMLKNAKPKPNPNPPTFDDDEPPVRLSGSALRLWQGEASEISDRSSYLWAIAKELYRSGATAKTILGAIAERDVSLGFNKYASRPDGGLTAYRNTTIKAIADVEAEPIFFNISGNETAAETPSPDIETLQNEIARLREKQSLLLQVMKNPALGLTGHTAISVIFDVTKEINEGRGVEGWVRTSRGDIAKNAGRSLGSVTSDLKVLDDLGIIERDVVRVPTQTIDADGVINPSFQSELRVRLKAPPRECLLMLRDCVQDEPERRGGKRIPRCILHPEADVVIRTEIRCAECEELLQDPTEQFIPPDDVKFKDCISEDTLSHVDRTIGFKVCISHPHSNRNGRSPKQPCVDCGEPSTSYRCSPCAAAATPERVHRR